MNFDPPVRSLDSKRGSVLIVALIFAVVIALSLTSFLKLAQNASKMANRSFYSNGGQNLVDTGLEQALWSLNQNNWTGAGFAARSGFANQYQGTFPSSSTYYDFSQGVKGRVNVWVDASGSTPHAVAQAIVTLGDKTTLVKEAETYMRKRSYFANGLVAKDTLTFVGNVAIDSWNSHSDTTSTADDVSYAAGAHHDNGQIASLSIQVDSISVGNADVYGYAAVGGSNLSSIDVGATGRLGPYGTGNGVIDDSRVTYDFTTNFPDVSAPAHVTTLAAISSSITLPRAGDVGVTGIVDPIDGKTYYYYDVPSISIAGHDVIDISAGKNVVLTVTGTSGTTVQGSGNSEIDIPATATLKMYVAGNISLTGNGVVNGSSGTPNLPTSFQLYGTRTAADAASVGQQTFAVKGNGYLSGIVYAPNANTTVGGNGDTYGAIVANRVGMNGNGNFHYDESLGNFASTNIWSVSKWRELTSQTDRNTYTTQLSF